MNYSEIHNMLIEIIQLIDYYKSWWISKQQLKWRLTDLIYKTLE